MESWRGGRKCGCQPIDRERNFRSGWGLGRELGFGSGWLVMGPVILIKNKRRVPLILSFVWESTQQQVLKIKIKNLKNKFLIKSITQNRTSPWILAATLKPGTSFWPIFQLLWLKHWLVKLDLDLDLSLGPPMNEWLENSEICELEMGLFFHYLLLLLLTWIQLD